MIQKIIDWIESKLKEIEANKPPFRKGDLVKSVEGGKLLIISKIYRDRDGIWKFFASDDGFEWDNTEHINRWCKEFKADGFYKLWNK